MIKRNFVTLVAHEFRTPLGVIMSAADILAKGSNLDIKNPNAKQDLEHLPPEKLADDILQKELRIAEIMREIKELLGRKP